MDRGRLIAIAPMLMGGLTRHRINFPPPEWQSRPRPLPSTRLVSRASHCARSGVEVAESLICSPSSELLLWAGHRLMKYVIGSEKACASRFLRLRLEVQKGCPIANGNGEIRAAEFAHHSAAARRAEIYITVSTHWCLDQDGLNTMRHSFTDSVGQTEPPRRVP